MPSWRGRTAVVTGQCCIQLCSLAVLLSTCRQLLATYCCLVLQFLASLAFCCTSLLPALLYQVSRQRTSASASPLLHLAVLPFSPAGIPWDRLQWSRAKYRENRVQQYRNYTNLLPEEAAGPGTRRIQGECQPVRKVGAGWRGNGIQLIPKRNLYAGLAEAAVQLPCGMRPAPLAFSNRVSIMAYAERYLAYRIPAFCTPSTVHSCAAGGVCNSHKASFRAPAPLEP